MHAIFTFQTIPFDKVDIRLLQVDYSLLNQTFPGTRDDLRAFLEHSGYYYLRHALGDDIFVKNGYVLNNNSIVDETAW